jgi:hypothetical protein
MKSDAERKLLKPFSQNPLSKYVAQSRSVSMHPVGAMVGNAVGLRLGANVTHTFDSQFPPKQSLFDLHIWPMVHPWQFSPPQSRSDSSPF